MRKIIKKTGMTVSIMLTFLWILPAGLALSSPYSASDGVIDPLGNSLVIETKDGGYLVIGGNHSFGVRDYEMWMLKLDHNGNIVWEKAYVGSSIDSAASIRKISDGGYIVFGGNRSFDVGDQGMWVLKLDENGNILWQNPYGGVDYDLTSSIQPTGGSSPASMNISSNQRNFKIGIGPIVRNFPGLSDADWLDMFQKTGESAEILIAQNEWREQINGQDSPVSSGQVPILLQLVGNLKGWFDYTPFFGINFFVGEGVPILNTDGNPVNDWTNEEAKQKYKQVALSICRTYNAQYLGLGIEVNTYYQYHPDDFDRFVTAYSDIYDAVKKDCPSSKMFLTFQLEKMKGLGAKRFGRKIDPQWDLLDKFGDKLDLAVFTTYPEIVYASPDRMPANYYSEISSHTNKKIAFSEIGWGTKGFSEEVQASFVSRFVELTQGLDMEFVNWAFMHDLTAPGPLTKVGLRKSDGTPKKSWAEWTKLKQLPLTLSK